MSQPLEIRNRPGTGMFRALSMLVVAGMLGFLAVKAAELDSGRGVVFLTGVLALGALAICLRDWQRSFDRRVQLVLDSQGFRDRRAGNVLVPWSDVLEVRFFSFRRVKFVIFKLDGPVPPGIRYASGASALAAAMPWADEATVRVNVTDLDWSGPDIIAAVRNLAPHVRVA